MRKVENQNKSGQGSSICKKEFAGSTGFSAQNLWFMRQLYTEYKDFPNLLQLVREIPWGQNIAIMTKINSFPTDRRTHKRRCS